MLAYGLLTTMTGWFIVATIVIDIIFQHLDSHIHAIQFWGWKNFFIFVYKKGLSYNFIFRWCKQMEEFCWKMKNIRRSLKWFKNCRNIVWMSQWNALWYLEVNPRSACSILKIILKFKPVFIYSLPVLLTLSVKKNLQYSLNKLEYKGRREYFSASGYTLFKILAKFLGRPNLYKIGRPNQSCISMSTFFCRAHSW